MVLSAVACMGVSPPPQGGNGLAFVSRWAVQLQGVTDPLAMHRLEAAPVDLVVVDAVRSERGQSGFAIDQFVRKVQQSREGKLCIAYLNIGQAEDYRAYWRADWKAPTATEPGSPSFLVTVDPDGWAGNYPVAFWDGRWRQVLFGHEEALLDQILEDGFDGIYMDWVLGYGEPSVAKAARDAGVDPAHAMVELIASLRAYARARNPKFLLIAQNGVDLVEKQPRLLDVIDGVAQEDLSFAGSSAAAWDDATSGDVAAPPTGPWSTRELGERLSACLRRGVPVFTLDYACSQGNVSPGRRAQPASGVRAVRQSHATRSAAETHTLRAASPSSPLRRGRQGKRETLAFSLLPLAPFFSCDVIIPPMDSTFPVERVRSRFPGLAREVASRPAEFFDGPATAGDAALQHARRGRARRGDAGASAHLRVLVRLLERNECFEHGLDRVVSSGCSRRQSDDR